MLTAVLAVTLATACGGDSRAAKSETRKGKTVELVVPDGTAARMKLGESVVVMPARLELRVGDTLLIRNEDSVDQSVGPYYVKAGGKISLTYGKAGRFEGYCPVSEGQHYVLVVTE